MDRSTYAGRAPSSRGTVGIDATVGSGGVITDDTVCGGESSISVDGNADVTVVDDEAC